jgi:hypothetical protein
MDLSEERDIGGTDHEEDLSKNGHPIIVPVAAEMGLDFFALA